MIHGTLADGGEQNSRVGAVGVGERERGEKDKGSQAGWVSWGSNKPQCFALKLKKEIRAISFPL